MLVGRIGEVEQKITHGFYVTTLHGGIVCLNLSRHFAFIVEIETDGSDDGGNGQ